MTSKIQLANGSSKTSNSNKVLVPGLSTGNFFLGVLFATVPDRKAESNLVHEIGKVVHQMERGRVNFAGFKATGAAPCHHQFCWPPPSMQH